MRNFQKPADNKGFFGKFILTNGNEFCYYFVRFRSYVRIRWLVRNPLLLMANMYLEVRKMYAVVEYKGNQYKAEKDAVLTVSRIDDVKEAKPGDKITIDTVLLVSDGDKVSVGTPYVQGAKVTVEVGETFKDKKVLVFKYKSKKFIDELNNRLIKKGYNIGTTHVGKKEDSSDNVIDNIVRGDGSNILLSTQSFDARA